MLQKALADSAARTDELGRALAAANARWDASFSAVAARFVGRLRRLIGS